MVMGKCYYLSRLLSGQSSRNIVNVIYFVGGVTDKVLWKNSPWKTLFYKSTSEVSCISTQKDKALPFSTS